MTVYTVSSAILQMIGAGFLCYVVARISINAYLICQRKQSVRHGISSGESVLETMEEK